MPFDNPYFPSQFNVGTPGGSHIHFANDGSMTLYGNDGVTVLARLDNTGANVFQGTITGALLETGPAPNQRMAMTVQAGIGFLFGYTGHGTETEPGYVSTGTQVAPNAGTILTAIFSSPANAVDDVAALTLGSASSAGSGGAGNQSSAVLQAGLVVLAGAGGIQMQWNGTTFSVDGGITSTGGITAQAEVYSQGASAGHSFDDRNAGSGKWEWYAHDSLAALWNAATGDTIQVVNDGTVTIAGGDLHIGPNSQRVIAMFNNSGIMRGGAGDPSIGFPNAAGQWSTDAAQADLVIRTNARSVLFNMNGGTNRAAAIVNPQGGLSVGRIDSGALGLAGASRIFMSSGVPPNGAGANGDFCFRYDTPGTANTRLYVRSAGAWVGIL